MGYRTVVMLSNDHAHEWSNDPELGRKIFCAMNHAGRADNEDEARVDNYGRVVQCVHADVQSLAVLDAYNGFVELADKSWQQGEQPEELALKLLSEAAHKLGYNLVKKAA